MQTHPCDFEVHVRALLHIIEVIHTNLSEAHNLQQVYLTTIKDEY